MIQVKQLISNREKEVLEKISFGHTTKEIAQLLFLSPHTVEQHRKNLLLKLDVRNTAGLIRKGFEYGFLSFHNHTYNSSIQI